MLCNQDTGIHGSFFPVYFSTSLKVPLFHLHGLQTMKRNMSSSHLCLLLLLVSITSYHLHVLESDDFPYKILFCG